MADRDPWEVNYSSPKSVPPVSSGTTGYTVKGLEGTEPKINLQPVQTKTSEVTIDPWERTYQQPEQPTGYNYPQPTYQSKLPWPLNRVDEAVDDSIKYMADGVMRAYNASTVDEKLAGLSETMRGFFNTAGVPFLLQAGAAAPLRTAAGLGAGVFAQHATEAGLKGAGAGQGTSEFAGDIAGLITGVGTPRLLKKAGGVYDILTTPEVARAGVEAIPFGKGAVKFYDAYQKAKARVAARAPQPSPEETAKPTPQPARPVTSPTDDGLLQLYATESDPAKLRVLHGELIKRGLIRANGPDVAPETNPYRTYSQNALRQTYQTETNPNKRTLMEQAARDRNLSLLTREGRRASAAVPETGYTEPTGPSVTQDDALMLRYLGIEDPLRADAETIATARQLAGENPTLLSRLRAGTTEQPAATPQPTPPTEPPAAAAPPPAPPAPPSAPTGTPGQQYAASQGIDWKSLSAKERVFMEQAARAQQNFAEQQMELVTRPTPQERAIISQPPAETVGGASEVPTLEYNAPTAEPAPTPAAPGAPEPTPPPSQVALDLETALRPEMVYDYLVRNKIPGEMVDRFTPDSWRLITEGAGLKNPPTPEEIAGIRSRLSEYEGAATMPAEAGNLTPEEATQQFEQRRQVRTRGRKKLPVTETPTQAPTQSQQQAPGEGTLSWKRETAPYYGEGSGVYEWRSKDIDGVHYRIQPSGEELGMGLSVSENGQESLLDYFPTLREAQDFAAEHAREVYGPAPEEIARSLKDLMETSGTAAPPPPATPSPRAPTASETRIEAFARHFAENPEYPPELVNLLKGGEANTNALRMIEKLGESLGIEGRPTAEELPAIADRMRQIRGETAAAPKGLYDQLQQAGEAAKQRLKEGFKGDQLYSLFPADKAMDLATLTAAGTAKGVKAIANRAMADMGEWGAARIAGGFIKYPEWSKQMLADAAEVSSTAADFLQKNMRAIYKQSQQTFKQRQSETLTGRISDIEKILRYAEAGKEGTYWYKHVKPVLQPIFGPNTDLFLNFLAATSPRTPVADNVVRALKAYNEYLSGEPFSTEFEAHRGNLERAAAGQPLSGLKVGSFGPNLLGDFIRVTVDTWMAQAYGFAGKLSDPQYRFLDYAISQAAKLKGLQPAEMQAAIWTGIKKLEGDPRLTAAPFEEVVRQYLKENPEIDTQIRKAMKSNLSAEQIRSQSMAKKSGK